MRYLLGTATLSAGHVSDTKVLNCSRPVVLEPLVAKKLAVTASTHSFLAVLSTGAAAVAGAAGFAAVGVGAVALARLSAAAEASA